MRRFVLAMLFLLPTLPLVGSDEIQRRQESLLYPIVRVRTATGGGSGTVIYSEARYDKNVYRTYILTNHHVVASAIKVERRWDGATQSYVTEDVSGPVQAEIFSWHEGTIVDKRLLRAIVFAYSEAEDLALLELRSEGGPYPLKITSVAKVAYRGQARALRVFQPIFVVGCSLGHDPIHSVGDITDLEDLIYGKTYAMGSAPIIFGNSGGAVFADLEGQFRVVGVPALISIAGPYGAVSHMNWFIPTSRIWQFFEDQKLEFLYDGTKTPEDAVVARGDAAKKKATGTGAEGGKSK